jgi:uncharacterized protein (DUF169 family)
MGNDIDVQQLLGLRQGPLAVGFLASIPAGLPRWDGPALAAGCGFWPRVDERGAFYTLADDHQHCAVGCHTHHLPLPPERAGDLPRAIGLMTGCGYIDASEVEKIPVMPQAPKAVAYGPADEPGFEPDVVIVTAKPAQAMLVYEAALKAGAGNALTHAIGRPACAVLPLTAQSNAASASFGCKGNRIHTGLPEDEMYVSIPAAKWNDVKRALVDTCRANETMSDYYVLHRAEVEKV